MTSATTTPPTVLLCEQDLILGVGEIGADFFQRVLSMDINAVLLTDESSLSDFSFCGNYGFADSDPSQTLNQAYKQWDAWMISKIQEEYDLELTTTRVLLITLFAQLETCSPKNRLLH